MRTYKEIKRALKITDEFTAKVFGFQNTNSFRNSSKASTYRSGIESFYNKAIQPQVAFIVARAEPNKWTGKLQPGKVLKAFKRKEDAQEYSDGHPGQTVIMTGEISPEDPINSLNKIFKNGR